MRSNSLLFGIIGTLGIAIATITGEKNLQTNISITDHEDELFITETIKAPKKSDLIGTYIVKNDKNAKLTLNNDGTYSLTINVCEKYLELTGTYELRDSKLTLNNDSSYHPDLEGNDELSFSIIDEKTLKSDESLVCTIQETLFEK